MEKRKIKNPWLHREGYNCFGCAPGNEYGLKMEFYDEGEKVSCVWKPSTNYQGWIDTLHGGIQATLLDEICAWAVMRQMGRAGVTSKMETTYKRPIKTTDEWIRLEARVTETRRNIAYVEAAIYDMQGNQATTARCIYFTFTPEKAREEMGFEGCELEA